MVLLGSGRHTVGLCGSDLYLTPPTPVVSYTGKNHKTEPQMGEAQGGWVGGRGSWGHLLGDLHGCRPLDS